MENSPELESSIKAWIAGEKTLKEVQGMTDDEIASLGYLGTVLLEEGKLDDAQKIFECLIALDPNLDHPYRGLGGVLLKRGNYDGAMLQFSNSLQVNPRSPHGYINRAELHIYSKDHAAARKDLESCLGCVSPKEAALSQKIWALMQIVKDAQS